MSLGEIFFIASLSSSFTKLKKLLLPIFEIILSDSIFIFSGIDGIAIIPLIRDVGMKTFNNVGSFVFSIFGPFSEVLWFAFSSLMTLGSVGKTTLNLTDDISGALSIDNEDLDTFKRLMKEVQLGYKKGGGKCKKNKILSKFDKKVKRFYYDFF